MSAAAKEEDEEKVSVPNASDALYVIIAAASVDENGARSKVFQQDELLQLGSIANTRELMPLVQFLAQKGLFRTVKVGGKLGWSVRPREAARQIVNLDRDEKTIYEIIEEAHTTGIWTRDLKKKTSIAQNVVQKALSKMEKGNLIKSVKSVKAPAQRTYMLSHLSPSEDVTGNSFFDAGDLDESFRDELLNLIVFWVRTDIEDIASSTRPKYRSLRPDLETDHTQLLYRAGTHSYPTAEEIHQFLTTSSAIKPTKAASLTVAEIQGCIDVLIWDDKLEPIRRHDGAGWGYRTVRGVSFKPPGSVFEEFEEAVGTGLTQAPCGHCPVFDLCHDSGPINAAECVYFEQWLKV
ncbi:uncharacterized protein MYCGRDRAFT_64857 [Zymoseptoria tritici IPO323]|uniref:DNA-directed RNA polymerase III subunit RPC6 n=1 Tax=Zymoseptoria tritici (strain CBS 115943 / IPO323) TaxID=336722 RepID=F9WXB6_ZYMTI|nr:uncharacterized protein MYCGRDRAFT_64857 [Zymoseptoria tritici IPO323]EGP90809.1 hypothetical protein MYCGRDRAFT_64857 [Zymoseptoria tritici IPO323]